MFFRHIGASGVCEIDLFLKMLQIALVNVSNGPLEPESCFFLLPVQGQYPSRSSLGLNKNPQSGFSPPVRVSYFSGPGTSGPGFPSIFSAYNYIFSSYSNLESMLDRLVLKNAADCTSQRLKRSSGAQVMTFLLQLHFLVVFEPREYARTISFEKCCKLHSSTSQTNFWARVMFFLL